MASQIYLYPEMAQISEDLGNVEDLEDLKAMLPAIALSFDAAHCTVHVVKETPSFVYRKKVLTTYSADWVANYISKRHDTSDPVAFRARQGKGFFFWDELKLQDPLSKSFMDDAGKMGIGPSGLTTICQDCFGGLVAVSLSSCLTHEEFRAYNEDRLSDLTDLSEEVVEVFSDILGATFERIESLTDEHIMVLHAVASGKNIDEISRFSFLFDSFSNIEKSILDILNAETLAQAAVTASRKGLLDDVSYAEWDIISSTSKVGRSIAEELSSDGEFSNFNKGFYSFSEGAAKFSNQEGPSRPLRNPELDSG